MQESASDIQLQAVVPEENETNGVQIVVNLPKKVFDFLISLVAG